VRILTWAVRLVVFILLVAFAAKNVEPVTLRFYFDLAVQAPLVLVLFAFFLLGALFGITALLGTLFRQRREISALKRELAPSAPVPPMPPPI
jgi:lipopolysaccharide assembly protein A